jgi:hypothetical protein
MSRIVIAAFKPKPGREAELMQVLSVRLPLLRKLGLATGRTNITMRAANGTILDVSEWVDDDAIARAHHLPEVLELWRRFEECSDYTKLNSLAEATHEFATFEAIDLEGA